MSSMYAKKAITAIERFKNESEIFSVAVRSPFFKKKLFGSNLGKLGPNLPKFQVFGKSFKFASLNFSDFAYFNRQT